MQIIETKVYNFTELNDEAKEVARNWYRENTLDYDWRDSVYEDARQCAEILGIDIDRIYFSGFLVKAMVLVLRVRTNTRKVLRKK